MLLCQNKIMLVGSVADSTAQTLCLVIPKITLSMTIVNNILHYKGPTNEKEDLPQCNKVFLYYKPNPHLAYL